jgi:hypothetical protein
MIRIVRVGTRCTQGRGGVNRGGESAASNHQPCSGTINADTTINHNRRRTQMRAFFDPE